MTNPEQIKNLFDRVEALERIQTRHNELGQYFQRRIHKHDRQIARILGLIGSMDLDRAQRQQLVRAIHGSEDE